MCLELIGTSCIVWEPPIDEPPPTAISIEDYIRQNLPRRVRTYIEDCLAAGDHSYDLTQLLANQMMDIFETQIDFCILEHRAQMIKENNQKNNPPTPPISSSRSPADSMGQRGMGSSPLALAPPPSSDVPEDWFATYLQSEEIPWDR